MPWDLLGQGASLTCFQEKFCAPQLWDELSEGDLRNPPPFLVGTHPHGLAGAVLGLSKESGRGTQPRMLGRRP